MVDLSKQKSAIIKDDKSEDRSLNDLMVDLSKHKSVIKKDNKP